jgi:hypothetical protein
MAERVHPFKGEFVRSKVHSSFKKDDSPFEKSEWKGSNVEWGFATYFLSIFLIIYAVV